MATDRDCSLLVRPSFSLITLSFNCASAAADDGGEESVVVVVGGVVRPPPPIELNFRVEVQSFEFRYVTRSPPTEYAEHNKQPLKVPRPGELAQSWSLCWPTNTRGRLFAVR